MTAMCDKWRILLVDDEEDIRDVLFMALSDFGYDVRTAENATDALKLFNSASFPIVMTDIKMPGMDGIELLRRIKQINPDTEVIMITGHGDMDLAIKSLKFEAADFITKPINTNGLKIALKRVQDKIIMKRKLQEYTENLEALIEEKIQLQDRLASLGLMIGSISHSIKGWLTNLDAGLYMLDTGLEKQIPQRSKEGLSIVKTAIDRIKHLVLDILFYAKERQLNKTQVDLPDFANDLAKAVETKIHHLPIQLIKDFEQCPKQVSMDPDLMRVAVLNILENAVDACLEDTTKPTHQIRFTIKTDPTGLIMEIRDDGIGMDPEKKEAIFDLFFSTKGKKGTGFGLFIAKNIVTQHQGTVHVTSAPGKGALFTIKLPT